MEKEKQRQAYMCTKFQEYEGSELERNPNLGYGDGECLAQNTILHGQDNCSIECKLWEELK